MGPTFASLELRWAGNILPSFNMSGHSKWANIRIRKGAQDAKRNKVYTRHARLVEIAARGGADPLSNTSLRAAIDNARADSVPSANIERAIKKGSGELKGEAMQEITYEAYGPAGTAYVIECMTNNRNRTIANVKLMLGKAGGRFAEHGSVVWMFERKGIVAAATSEKLKVENEELEKLELELIDFGAEDFSYGDGHLRIVTAVVEWPRIRDFLKQKGWIIESAGLSYVPKQKVPVPDEATAEKIATFMEKIEEDDDVVEVHTNADL
jgi:YebC/PmpR family DNA-binding regulatory protein